MPIILVAEGPAFQAPVVAIGQADLTRMPRHGLLRFPKVRHWDTYLVKARVIDGTEFDLQACII